MFDLIHSATTPGFNKLFYSDQVFPSFWIFSLHSYFNSFTKLKSKFNGAAANTVCKKIVNPSLPLSGHGKVPMEKENNISCGGTIILLALFAQNLIFGQRYILSRSSDSVSHFKKALKYKKANGDYCKEDRGEIRTSLYLSNCPARMGESNTNIIVTNLF